MVDAPILKQSDWNTAGFTNYRFHKIKELCHESRWTEDYKSWLGGLYAFYSELHPQLKSEDRVSIKKKLVSARESLKEKSFDKQGVFDSLFEVELRLEEVFDEHGNKFNYKEDGSRALGRM